MAVRWYRYYSPNYEMSPADNPACDQRGKITERHGRVKGERGRVQVRRRPTVSALSGPVSIRRKDHHASLALLIEPDVQFSRIRLSDGSHTRACAGDVSAKRRNWNTPSSP